MASIINASTSAGGGLINTADSSGVLQLQTAGTAAVTVDASQNVGIGTSSPSYKLDVQLGSSVNAQVKNTGASGYAQWKTVSPTTTVNFGSDSNGGYMETVGAYSNLFYTNGLERMRIDSSGLVLIGTTTAVGSSNTISGAGTSNNSLNLNSTDTSTGFSTLGFYSGGTYKSQVFWQASNARFTFQNGTGGLYIATNATAFTANSDERKKDIIENIENASEKVSTLRAVIGKYKTDEEGTRRAFLIAQDVQAVLPEAVDASDPEDLGVQYSDVIPLLVAAIKELKAELDTVKAQLAGGK